MPPHTPPPPGAPTVCVTDGTYTADEPILGVGRYRDGSLILVAHRTPPWSPAIAGEIVYRTHPTRPGWHGVWACPRALTDFITTNPPGTTGKASNRRIEVLDHTVIPAVITISRERSTWIGY